MKSFLLSAMMLALTAGLIVGSLFLARVTNLHFALTVGVLGFLFLACLGSALEGE